MECQVEKEAERKAHCERLIAEYHDLTARIIRAEARMHSVCASRFAGTRERQVNDELTKQIDCMRGYRHHLMRRMAMLGIDLDTITI